MVIKKPQVLALILIIASGWRSMVAGQEQTARQAEPSESSAVVAPGAVLEKLADGFRFTEGPATDADGDVFFTDQPNDRIMKWSAADGSVEEWLKPAGRSNGLRFDEVGNLIACADEKNQLWSISPQKDITVLLSDFDGKLLNGPNDVWIRPDGGLYFTDPLYRRDYWTREPAMQQPGQYVYFLAKGARAPEVVADDLRQPNGVIGSPDGKVLYVADIGEGKTYAYDIQDDGTLAGRRLFCEMGSDGMTLDNQGNVYLTGRGVTVFDRSGRQIEQIPVPQRWTANVTFGGKDRKLLFITASSAVYGLRMSVAGP